MAKGDLLVTIPNPHGSTIGVKLLSIILQEAGIERDEWLSASGRPSATGDIF
jgi:hypothetical protein